MDNTLLEIFENESHKTLDITFSLDRIHCFDEGDGFGKAEPYLWPVYFKIDGTGAYFETIETLTLAGKVSIHTVAGEHGNLGVKNVDKGNVVEIPQKVGCWQTKLLPIPIYDYENWAIAQGIVGVFCILMEQDNMSGKAAKSGYKALSQSIKKELEAIIPLLSEQKRSLSQQEVESFSKEVSACVKKRIIKSQNILQNVWAKINQDDVIGTECFVYSHPELWSKKKKRFSKRWKNEGDWKIEGSISICKVTG